MPIKQLNRVWCSNCKEWELHERFYPNWEDWFCQECETKWEASNLKDIPIEKLKEQRERYKISTRYELGSMLLGGVTGLDMLSEPGSNVDIRESDAGQKTIDARKKEEREAEYAERHRIRAEQKAEVKRFQNIERNDLCLCGSGKKYKKCCEPKIRNYLL